MITVKKIHYYVIVSLALIVSLTAIGAIGYIADQALKRVDLENQEVIRR